MRNFGEEFLEKLKSTNLLRDALNKCCHFTLVNNVVKIGYINSPSEVIEWVISEMLPEQVYPESVLEDWARRNGFMQKRNEVELRKLADDVIIQKGDLVLFSSGELQTVPEIASKVERTVGECIRYNRNIVKILRKREV
jgi:hypothetical protein